MRDTTSETDRQADWDAATRVLAESTGEARLEPLSAEAQAQIVALALARRRVAADLGSRPGVGVLRIRRAGLLAAGLMVAASAVVVLREPADIGPISLDATATRALVRGQVPGDAGERPVLDVRNEPGWIVHLRPGGASEHLQLHIVAFTADGPPAVLPAASERTDDAFRVLGEVGALGLRPGNVTLYFVVGPHGAANEALALAEALQAGATLARGWAAKRLDIRVVDGS